MPRQNRLQTVFEKNLEHNMTDRIQELMDDCWDPARGVVNPRKLAYRVIKECMSCSTWVGVSNKNPVEPVHTAHAINVRIKRHFGLDK
jgi:hypothetical protein